MGHMHMTTLLCICRGQTICSTNTNCPAKLFGTNELFIPSLSMHRAQQLDGQMPPRRLARNKHGNGTIQISVQVNYYAVCQFRNEPLSK